MEDALIQRVPLAVRLNTGPVAMAGDWPGYFFRGDNLPTTTLRYAAKELATVGTRYADALSKELVRLADQMAQAGVGQSWKK